VPNAAAIEKLPEVVEVVADFLRGADPRREFPRIDLARDSL
jgi:hypothetical protein